MKKILFLLALILFLIFSINKVPNASAVNNCLTITGKFTATNWSHDSIMVACQGIGKTDSANAECGGDKTSVRPNNTFTLRNCACPYNTAVDPIKFKGWADGCLYVAKELDIERQPDRKNRPGVVVLQPFPSECTLNPDKFEKVSDFKANAGLYKSLKCGMNNDKITVNIAATCPGSTATNTPTPTTPVVTSTNTPTPTTSVCPVPNPVLNVRITCPNCSQTLTATPTLTPTPTPTADTRPECNKVDPTYSGRCNVETQKCRYTLYDTTGGTTTDVCDDVDSSLSCTKPEDCPQPTPTGGTI